MNIAIHFIYLALLCCSFSSNNATFMAECNQSSVSDFVSADYVEIGSYAVEIVGYSDQKKYLRKLQHLNFVQIELNPDTQIESYSYMIKACAHNIQNIDSEVKFDRWKKASHFSLEYNKLNGMLLVSSFSLTQSNTTRAVILKVSTPVAITDVVAVAIGAS